MITNSREGFNTKHWGKCAWRLIHVSAANYPVHPTPRQRKAYADFFRSLMTVLPCKVCRCHYTRAICGGAHRMQPKHFASRQALFEWTVRLHDAVARRLGQRTRPDAVAYWSRFYEKLRHHGGHSL